MKKYDFVYNGKVTPNDISEDQMKDVMDKWMEWFGTFKDQMVDGGNPFSPEAKVVTSDAIKSISPDMWPAKGYTIINAENMEEATKIAQGCPALVDDPEGAVRVYEALPM